MPAATAKAKSKVTARYNHIYVVSVHSTHTQVRVTQRQGMLEPRVVQFFPANVDEHENPIGVLDLTEELWKKWFGDVPAEEFMPGMETATSAAEAMVKRDPKVMYGCPLCKMRFTSLSEAQDHTSTEIMQFLEDCEVEVS